VTVFVVTEEAGEYEDRWWSTEGVYTTLEAAKGAVDKKVLEFSSLWRDWAKDEENTWYREEYDDLYTSNAGAFSIEEYDLIDG
jgi:hypothetical protein